MKNQHLVTIGQLPPIEWPRRDVALLLRTARNYRELERLDMPGYVRYWHVCDSYTIIVLPR